MSQAIYVLKCLEKGQTEQEIIDAFEGDSQLVEIWTAFLLHNHWVQKRDVSTLADSVSKWVVTDKGKEWTKGYVEKNARHDGRIC